jgi:hypothetical protein
MGKSAGWGRRFPQVQGRVSNANAAAIGLSCRRGTANPWRRSVSRLQKVAVETFVAKTSKNFKIVVDLLKSPAYKPLNNEGGAPLATKKFASKKAPELTRSREPRK